MLRKRWGAPSFSTSTIANVSLEAVIADLNSSLRRRRKAPINRVEMSYVVFLTYRGSQSSNVIVIRAKAALREEARLSMLAPIQRPPVYVVADDVSRHALLQRWLTGVGNLVWFRSLDDFFTASPTLSPGCLILAREENDVAVIAEIGKRARRFPAILTGGRFDSCGVTQAADMKVVPFEQRSLIDALQGVQTGILQDGGAGELVADPTQRLAQLNGQERQVLERIVTGRTRRSIATELDIEAQAVELPMNGVMTKMRAENLAELLRMALALGIKLH